MPTGFCVEQTGHPASRSLCGLSLVAIDCGTALDLVLAEGFGSVQNMLVRKSCKVNASCLGLLN